MKTNSQKTGKLIFPQVKCHLLCFTLIPRELVPLLGEVMFELEELIVPYEYSMCFAFFPGNLVIVPGKNSFGPGEKACNPGENCPPCLFPLIRIPLVARLDWSCHQSLVLKEQSLQNYQTLPELHLVWTL